MITTTNLHSSIYSINFLFSNILLSTRSWSIYVTSNTVSLLLKYFNKLARLWFSGIFFLWLTTELTYSHLNGSFLSCVFCEEKQNLVEYTRIQPNQSWLFLKALWNNCQTFFTWVYIDDICHMILFSDPL